MRPLEISMEAFGPYLQKNTIDFSRLWEHRIFLISGPTGGGKTAILDAMCFALYGKATGGQREFSQMRSTMAGDSQDTAVSFQFQLHGEVYRFDLGLHIHFKKGSGQREERLQAACYRRENGEWKLLESKSPRAVFSYAEQLLGFSYDQFSQLIVLPQGEFRKFLLAGSVEREQILQKLFRTQKWNQIATQIDQMAKQAGQGLDALFARRAALLEQEEVSSSVELLEKEALCREELDKTKQEAEKLTRLFLLYQRRLEEGRLLHSQFSELEQLEKRSSELEAFKDQMLEKEEKLFNAKKAEALQPYYFQWKEAFKDRQAKKMAVEAAYRNAQIAKDRLEEVKKEAVEIGALREMLSALSEKKGQLSGRLEEARRLEKLVKEWGGLKEQEARQKARMQEAQGRVELAEKQVNDGEAYVFKQRELIDRSSQAYAVLSQCREILEAYELREKRQELQKERQERLLACQAAEKNAEILYRTAEGNYGKLFEQRREREASQLAKDLQEGKPCPVCGSVHHPSPAIPLPEEVTLEEALHALKEELEAKEARWQEARQEGRMAEQSFAVAREEWEEAQKRCALLPMSREEALRNLDSCEEYLNRIKKAEEILPKAKERLEQRKRELTAASSEKEAASSMLENIRREMETKAALARECTERLGGAGPEEIEKQAEELSGKISQLNEKIQKISQEEEKAGIEAAKAAEQKEQSFQRNQEAREREQQLWRQWQERAKAAGFELEEELSAWMMEQEAVSALEKELQEYQQERRETENKRSALANRLRQEDRPELSDLEEKAQRAREKKAAADQRLGALEARWKQCAAVLRQLDEFESRRGKEEERYQRLEKIRNLVRGKNPLKTPLGQFVAGLMLDDILKAANLYLEKLSRGRYWLHRMTGDFSGGGSKGLELEVFDSHSGVLRPVGTLSGGEMFLASLSLALGLAEVVQQSAGGMNLDSIFIDEGFGTLDEETREAVMLALQQIRQSGRMVGMISHVSELKELIKAHIEVYRLPTGESRAQIRILEE